MKGENVFKVTAVALLLIVFLGASFAGACSKPAPSPSPAPAPAPKPASPQAASTPKPAAATPAPAKTPAASPSSAAPAGAKLPKDFVIPTSGSGSSPALRAFFAEMITKYTGMRASVEKTTGIEQGTVMIASGKAQGTFYSPPGVKVACINAKITVRTLVSGAGSGITVLGIYTKPKAGIKTIKDLKGKMVYVDKPAMGWPPPLMDAWLKVNGMTRKDFKWLEYSEANDCFRDLKEGRVDAFFYNAGAGTQEMAQTTGIYVIPLTPEEQQAAVDVGLGYEKYLWRAGEYGNPTDTPTVAANKMFYVDPAMSDDTAYTVVKMLFDHLKEFHASQKEAEGFNKDTALSTWAFPYHAGAIKYFKEAGIWNAEADKRQQQALDEEKKRLGK